jgi:opacity protein-like surface antigen
LLLAIFVLFAVAAGASAQEEEDPVDPSDFSRTGFYIGAGGTAAFPDGWDSDLDNDLNEQSSELANERAANELSAIDEQAKIIPLDITVDGADLEDAFLGLNGVIGYRVAEAVAFELEGEWLFGSNETSLDVTGSTGFHQAEVKRIWTLTTNVKVYPFTGRFQPFAVAGAGLQHSVLDVDLVTSGITTTEQPPQPAPGQPPNPPMHTLSGDFQIKKRETKLDGAVRVGGGLDIYATPNIVASFSATYVRPFAEVGSMTTDYLSLVLRVLYRF